VKSHHSAAGANRGASAGGGGMAAAGTKNGAAGLRLGHPLWAARDKGGGGGVGLRGLHGNPFQQ
jgi:hypothetical protein